MANVLKAQGVAKGDRVTIYLPMIPEAAYAMLACARIGAVHSVIFGGFSPDSIAGRIQDCGSRIVITADEGLRGGRKVPLKAMSTKALEQLPGRRDGDRHQAHRRGRTDDRRPRHSLTTKPPLASAPTARPSRWGRRTPSSSSTPPARPVSPKACCTPPAVIWPGRRIRTS